MNCDIKNDFNIYTGILPHVYCKYPERARFIGSSKKNLKIYDVTNCLNKNLITHFACYLEKEIRCDIETLSIDRKLNKGYFSGKIMQKMCTNC